MTENTMPAKVPTIAEDDVDLTVVASDHGRYRADALMVARPSLYERPMAKARFSLLARSRI